MMRNSASLALAAIGFAALPATASEQANPAHEIANRFAENGKTETGRRSPTPSAVATTTKTRPPISQTAPAQLDPVERAPKGPDAAETPTAETGAEPRDAELQKTYEEEMLARAKAEAEARTKADLQREEQAARDRAAAQSGAREKAERERLEGETAAQARRALEAEAARIAREEETRRQRDAERQAAQDQAAQREQESHRLTERLRTARKTREEERARKQAQAAETEARLAAEAQHAKGVMRKRVDHLAERIQANRRARLAAERLPHPSPDATSPIATGTTHAPPTPEPSRASNRATILLVMSPGNRGIRRWNKTADPMLCVEENCYISHGEDKPAKRISRNKGFGPGIALGKRAGACRNQLACVFRDVELSGPRAWMQPVDLRILRHDRRESRMIATDPTCTLVRGRLDCRQTIESEDYRAWIVPEEVAREAGPAALHEALSGGLGVSHAAVMRHN